MLGTVIITDPGSKMSNKNDNQWQVDILHDAM